MGNGIFRTYVTSDEFLAIIKELSGDNNWEMSNGNYYYYAFKNSNGVTDFLNTEWIFYDKNMTNLYAGIKYVYYNPDYKILSSSTVMYNNSAQPYIASADIRCAIIEGENVYYGTGYNGSNYNSIVKTNILYHPFTYPNIDSKAIIVPFCFITTDSSVTWESESNFSWKSVSSPHLFCICNKYSANIGEILQDNNGKQWAMVTRKLCVPIEDIDQTNPVWISLQGGN